MRVFVLALAILLLPLRGWLGDAMAIEAAQPAPIGHATHTMQADEHAMHDMAGHAHDTHHSDGAAAEPAHTPDDCHTTCGDCQLCHSVAIALWPELAALVAAPRTAPAFAPAAFVSAQPKPGLKPPIS